MRTVPNRTAWNGPYLNKKLPRVRRVFSLLDTIETTRMTKTLRNAVTPSLQAFIRGGKLGIKKEGEENV